MDIILQQLINSLKVNLNVCNLNPTGLLLLTLSSNIIMDGHSRIEIVKYLVDNTTLDLKTNVAFLENPLLLSCIMALDKNMLSGDQLFELVSVLLKTNVNINQKFRNIDDIPYGLPIDIILLNPKIDIILKKQFVKLFVDNKYVIHEEFDRNKEKHHLDIPNIVTKILCYDDKCICNYNGDLCNDCKMDKQYNASERYELADFILKEYPLLHFHMDIYVEEIFDTFNTQYMFDALKFLLPRYLDNGMVQEHILYPGFEKCIANSDSFSHLVTMLSKYHKILENSFLLLSDYGIINLINEEYYFRVNASVMQSLYKSTAARRKAFVNYVENISDFKVKYTSFYYNEMMTLMCITKYCNLSKYSLNQIIKYKIIPLLSI